ncbi:serine hydrolase domain-containing protein [Pseudomonas canadensis]|uniref:serine hydrolase domain-containing protein n=1 Tax=Pseudomonas canadensis TaxID=915099 RepID=UPI002B245497|nr:serine hydrolase domain-containing protein [Pseudomonas canadensis]MEB2647782.1 serine hydrolase domain-containing protein [Pseudomonas canadensis]
MGIERSAISDDANLQIYLHELMRTRKIPGAQIAVVKNREIVYSNSIGYADLEHKVPVSQNSVFSINSIAKAFTGVAIMQLVEEGLLDLSSKLSSYLDDLPGAWGKISIRQLAALTSGLPDVMTVSLDGSIGLIGDGSEDAAWLMAYEMPLISESGIKFNYSQTDYALLGRVIEKLSGMRFTDFVIERQLVPLGMGNTKYANDCDIIEGRATTYNSLYSAGAGPTGILRSCLNWPEMLRPAAGLHSTALDLAQWVISLQANNLLKSPSSYSVMREPIALANGSLGIMGIGWLSTPKASGHVSVPSGGCKSQITIYQDGLAIIFLTNLIGGLHEHLSAVSGDPINIGVMDEIAGYFE